AEDGPDARLLGGAYLPFQDDVDRTAVQGGDQVGELVRGGAQIDVAAQRIVEERGVGDGGAVDRSLRAAVRIEVGPGADLADVVLGEELGVGQGHRDFLQVRVAGTTSGKGRSQFRESAAASASAHLHPELWLEAEGAAVEQLEVLRGTCAR